MLRFLKPFLFLLLCCLPFSNTLVYATPEFTAFESGQVRPLALSPDKKFLFAVNTPDNRLEIFRIENKIPVNVGSVQVGLEPVAVSARTNNEVWVVNHLSDSISIVTFNNPQDASVKRTLLVGDEPRDIVFAGNKDRFGSFTRAFITAAHRGQNLPTDPQLTTPGIGRADVWVFDTAAVIDSLVDKPLKILTLFSDSPRALAVTADGSKVYASAFNSGNQTTNAFFPPVLPEPTVNFEGLPQPPQGVIVKFDGDHWSDQDGNTYDEFVNFSLPDKDVFVIDALADPPQQMNGSSGYFSGVGTVLFNMVVNPVNKKIYVSNLEAFNNFRFEGPGDFSGSSLRGHLHESRITVLDGESVLPRHLNKHIDYTSCCASIPNAENEKSLAFPLEMAITSDGKKLYVTALGSSKIGIFDTKELENDTFVPNIENQITISGGGPSGIVLDENRKSLYVLTRFDNSISVVDTETRSELAHVSMHNPEPDEIIAGRRFLYDAAYSSSHGDSACASCHMFGDFDGLAWNLGNPDGKIINNPGPFVGPPLGETSFHPMKGPLVTQSLRGMNNHGPMHWRGDRTGGNDAPSIQPDSGAFDEHAAFLKFLPAFVDLLGRDKPILKSEMEAFSDFILQVVYPPNPIRALNNSLTEEQQRGKDLFFDPAIQFNGEKCDTCHVLDLNANADALWPGFFGSDGRNSKDSLAVEFKTPHLRNMYQKVGMFGMTPNASFLFPTTTFPFMGDQIRGYGYLKDGSVDTLSRFVSFFPFNFPPSATDPENDPNNIQGRKDLEEYMLAFESNLAPIVGQQVTLNQFNRKEVSRRIDLLEERHDAGECELIAKANLNGVEYGFLYQGNNLFAADRSIPFFIEIVLRKLFPKKYLAIFLERWSERPPDTIQSKTLRGFWLKYRQPLTFTCVPLGSGNRLGLDRDRDGHFNGDELILETDPASAMPQ